MLIYVSLNLKVEKIRPCGRTRSNILCFHFIDVKIYVHTRELMILRYISIKSVLRTNRFLVKFHILHMALLSKFLNNWILCLEFLYEPPSSHNQHIKSYDMKLWIYYCFWIYKKSFSWKFRLFKNSTNCTIHNFLLQTMFNNSTSFSSSNNV